MEVTNLEEYFTRQLVNRINMPEKLILVCEDDLYQQARIAAHLAEILDPQGNVEVCYVSGGAPAAMIIEQMIPDLILLDHDMPSGGGAELMKWIEATRAIKPPVLTFSGIPSNNDHLMSLGAKYKFQKDEVINGAADDIIRQAVA